MHFTKLFLSILGVLLLAGCQEDFPTYSTFCDQETMTPPTCLHYAVLNKQDKVVLQKHFAVADDPKCAYRIELTKYHAGSCNNPIVKSTGSDFDGYVRVEVKKGFKCYYKVQSDYKNDMDAAFKRVLKRSKKELSL